MKVFYDGACPMCSREIEFYKSRQSIETVEWVDLAKLDSEFAYPGISREQALKRFHVVTPQGQILSGGAAFTQMLCSIRMLRPLGVTLRIAPLAWLLDQIYNQFLKIRPWLQTRMH